MPCIRDRQRRGINRIEVMIVLALVVLGVCVAMVALPKWWENSARLRCQEHLEKIGKAVGIHQDQMKYLPASRLDKGYATWAVQLAPFLPETDKSPLKKDWDLAATYYAQSDDVRQAFVPLFFCPARRYPPKYSIEGDVPDDKPGGKLYPGSLGDYACSAGDGTGDWENIEANGAVIPAKVVEKKGGQLLKWDLLIDLEKLPRGKAQTILVGEKHVPLGQFGKVADGDGSLYNGDYMASFARVGGPGFGLAQSSSAPFNKNFGSAHLKICQFLFADGHVKTFDNSLDEKLLGKLTNRHP